MVILDTCTLLWLASSEDKLSSIARETISKNAGSLFVSSISALEISIKHRRKKLKLPLPPVEWIQLVLELHGLLEIPVSSEIAAEAGTLPMVHNDPFDRIIIASALVTESLIVSPNRDIAKYELVRTIW